MITDDLNENVNCKINQTTNKSNAKPKENIVDESLLLSKETNGRDTGSIPSDTNKIGKIYIAV